MPATNSRMSASSSTMRLSRAMLPPRRQNFRSKCALCAVRADRRCRDPQPHPGAALTGHFLGGVVQLDLPAVFLENASDDREAKAGPLLAGRHIGFEQPAAVFLRQPDPVVDHVDKALAAL